MAQALEEADAALEHGDVPIGAIVVHDGVVVGKGHNARELQLPMSELRLLISKPCECGADFRQRAEVGYLLLHRRK